MVIAVSAQARAVGDPATLGVAAHAPAGGFSDARLGVDHPAGWWPSKPRLKSYEAAGFAFLQVRMPERALLADEQAVVAHAAALREALSLTGLRLILHAPDDLLAGTPEHDHQLDGALTYASVAGSRLVVYHGARIPIGDATVRARLCDEERSLRRVLPRAGALGVRLAIENLAPVYRGIEYVCHDPSAVVGLVRRLDSAQVGMCLDVGHAHIAAELAGCEMLELVEPALEHVILFHVHDNLGARTRAPSRGGIEPLRLDLHLPPGAGTLPWSAIAPRLATHVAPVQLEVHPAGRPEPGTLAILTREVFRRAAGRGSVPRRARVRETTKT
ncbi:MAG TPA: sugar phosphate isomerase/epimerase [Solirubrobacteraceae bacterium]|jgi:sugar phosphate isomerase/epimerase|nr:sugar phosphate isomerase/epimerase [Solirubrobacteraceae bacterium]